MNFFNNNCGGGCGNGFGGCGCDPCSILLWLMILQCICGNGNGGCGIDCCTLIILLLLCGCGNGCGK